MPDDPKEPTMPDPEQPENDDAKVIRLPGWREAPSSPGGQVRQCEHMVAVAFGYFACGICGPLEPTDV